MKLESFGCLASSPLPVIALIPFLLLQCQTTSPGAEGPQQNQFLWPLKP
jgi:hypothetical protein